MFQREWLSDPEFSHWVSGLPDDSFAYCKLCDKDICVSNGKSQLRSHANGIKHRELERKYRGKGNKREEGETVCRGLSKGPSGGISVNVINAPFSYHSQGRRNVPASKVKPKSKPSSSCKVSSPKPRKPASTVRKNTSVPLPSTFLFATVPQDSGRKGQFDPSIDQMLGQNDTTIRDGCLSFLSKYRESVRYSVLASSSHLDRYSSVKGVLDDYVSQHKNLANRIKKKLVDAIEG